MAARGRIRTGTRYDHGEVLPVEDVGTWIVRAGPRGGTPVVMLHGAPTSAYLYRKVLEGMREEFDCIAFDWPGYGGSDPPRDGDYTHRARADHLAALLDALGLERVHLVVHDLGGPAGLLHAVENPERIKRLVVLNTTVYRRDHHPPLPALSQLVPVVRDLARRLLTRPVFEHFMRRGFARPGQVPREVLENHWRLVRRDVEPSPIFETWAQLPRGAPSVREIRARLPRFPRPVLVLFGAEDPFLPPPNAERFAKEFPDAQLELLPNVGHFLQEEAPEEVAERLGRFLR